MTKSLVGHSKDLGDNFVIRRVLPAMEKRSVGPFVFFDHFGPVPVVTGEELVVRAHPHIGLATITFLYDGVITHRDSLKVEMDIRPHETNWMVAGSGIVHSERSKFDPKYEILEGIQTWIALPKDKEEIDPSFEHFSEKEIPVLTKEGLVFRLLGGSFLGLKSPATVHSPLIYADIEIKQSADAVHWDLSDKEEAGLYVSRGAIESNGESYAVGSMVLFEKGTSVSFKAKQNSRLILLGGEPLTEKRHLFWNFVSTKQETIERAKERWAKDEFPKVPKEIDRIPLPN
ncbi:pirin family protein [Leptospira sp. 2 VSF19]|uniref:Pirin family protein n=1 Tax=Leptospira soteropolitanensis TaxID=2950025 RepID=A0AAW5VAB0_9LEPT|nr:pirin family protein [Leptospira soteropolitanensis]MCW7491178.1 pirin family protein [Leptospira soteropolitanensis]MCW7498762.1 pirin family protein [Leptospira soteropolitanensis]MCW7521645.1 pirin family protein [Leptospira soteropolitanensis]MCW7524866.1 pirin family protein [Leptospira soteropolitanensis]MCW7528733.1 pirin family protein [Leptospira soteropolitanensis]